MSPPEGHHIPPQRAVVFDCATPLGVAIAHEMLSRSFQVTACFDSASTTCPSLSARGADLQSVQPHLEDRSGERRIGESLRDAATFIMTDLTWATSRIIRIMEEANPGHCVFVSANDLGGDRVQSRFAGYASAETRIRSSKLPWTILRPTMTYGHAGDGNLSVLAQRLKLGKRTCVPDVDAPSHQPIHYQDLARAAATLATQPEWKGRTIPLAGPDKVSLPDLFDAVADAVDAQARPTHISAARIKFIIATAKLLNQRPPRGFSRSGHLIGPHRAVTPNDLPAEARPQIDLKSGLKLLAKDLSRLDGTREGAQLAKIQTPELPL